MKLHWRNIDEEIPKPKTMLFRPYITCIVYSCNPTVKIGGVIQTCRWDVAKKEWYKTDINSNWLLQSPYKITHFIDDMKPPIFITKT